MAPVASRAFQCNACGSLNLFDDAGNIISADPAMYDETLNTQSFAKRGVLVLLWIRRLVIAAYASHDSFPHQE